MWELIRANKRHSIFLMALMALVLLLVGGVIGLAVFGPDGGWIGLGVATVVWLVLALISLSSGDQILLAASHAQRVDHDVHPQLFNIVEEMKIAAGLPAMPKVYIINDPAPNAFATGRSPQSASLAVTAGLLARLNRDELQGVVAHEMAHVRNYDIRFATLVGVLVGLIALVADLFLRARWFGFGGRRGEGGGSAGVVLVLVGLVFAIVAPLAARAVQFMISRRRELLADGTAVELTRDPLGLAGALQKIAADPAGLRMANRATAHLYIANPLRKVKKSAGLFDTHPPIELRI